MRGTRWQSLVHRQCREQGRPHETGRAGRRRISDTGAERWCTLHCTLAGREAVLHRFRCRADRRGQPTVGRKMPVERITYRVNGKNFIGALIHDDRIGDKRPLMLIAPNWLGVNEAVIKRTQAMTGSRYIGFVADMYGDG